MTFILISGKPDVGKTRVCNRLHGAIGQNGTFKLRYKKSSDVACRDDHIRHYEKDGKHIVVSSASDGDKCMLELAKYLDELAKDGVHPDIIVTTIREEDDTEDTDKKEYPMSHMLALLEAIAKKTPNLEAHYTSNIMNKPIHTPFAPSALKHNAFVLHLEKQDKSSVDNEEKVLIPYCDDSADKIKYAIDFILARP
ncbi:MAG: hypothetical protein K2N58_06160 [Treponemataceae bacterium]|nr:hypothetical protein [Treponemataceae bacterium]